MTDALIDQAAWPEGRSSIALFCIDRILRKRLEQLESIISEMANQTDVVAKIELLESGRDIFISARRWMDFNSYPLITAAGGIAFSALNSFHIEFVKTLIYSWSAGGASMWAEAAAKQPRNKFELKRYKLWKLAGVESVPFIIEALPKNLKKEHLESAPIRVEFLASLLESEDFRGPLKDSQVAKLQKYCESPDPTQHDQELMREPIRHLRDALKALGLVGVRDDR